MFQKIRAMIKKMVVCFYRISVKVLPLSKNIVLFESNLGRNYTGNPRYIYEEMVRRGMDKKYRCVWFLDDPSTQIPGECKKVKRAHLRYLFYMAIGKVWCFDSRDPAFIVKRKGVTYIQTWHGTPLKKLALDMERVEMASTNDIDEYRKEFYDNAKRWDYLISQNAFSTETFRRCFAFDKTMLEIGYPRNDVLFERNTKEEIDKIKDKLHIPKNKKVILYAPTWRDNQFYAQGRYKFVSPLDYDKMRDYLGEDTILIVKYHYLVKDSIDWSKYKNFIYTFDETFDIASLYLVADALITDYSSVMFDYSILGRPMYFFAYDLEDYRQNLRGFYFDFLKEAPGPVSQTTDELINDITHYNKEEWNEKYKVFQKKYNHVDCGKASAKVVYLIHSILQGRKVVQKRNDIIR